LKTLLVPNMNRYSALLKAAAEDKIAFVNPLKKKLEGQKRTPPLADDAIADLSVEPKPEPAKMLQKIVSHQRPKKQEPKKGFKSQKTPSKRSERE
jgi:hypothetical protein